MHVCTWIDIYRKHLHSGRLCRHVYICELMHTYGHFCELMHKCFCRHVYICEPIPPTGHESQSESQARSVPGRRSEFNFADHFCHHNGRIKAPFFSLDSEPVGGLMHTYGHLHT
jgi:hypothetical protein